MIPDMEAVYIILIIIAVLLLIAVILLAPGRAGDKKTPFYGRNIAHRGLYTADQSIPENSLPAFLRAADHGYGLELDVQLSRDGRVVVFHDDTLKRMCGVASRVDELDYDELEQLRLADTDAKIPLFSDVLDAIGGRVPIVVELKNGKRNKELCDKTLAFLESYKGETCVESFNPLIVRYFMLNAPHMLRGQLAQPLKPYVDDGLSVFMGFLLSRVLFNVTCRPHFICYMIGKKPLSVRFSEALGAVKAVWTSHDESSERDYDIVIFEHYEPRIRYK